MSEAWDQLPCGVARVSHDSVLTAVNTPLCDWLGVDRLALLGHPLDHILTRAGALMAHSYLLPALQLHQQVEEVAITLQAAGGERIDTLLSARWVDDGDGPAAICTFLRQSGQQRLQAQLLMAKRAADEAPGMLFQLTQPVRGPMVFPFASQTMLALLGVGPARAAASADEVWARVHDDDRLALLQALHHSGQWSTPWRAEFRVHVDDGEPVWREVNAMPMRDADGGTLWHGYMADITERKLLEASVRDRLAAERASQAKNSFLSRMSHELRTPLNGVMGFAQLLSLHQADNLREDQKHKLECIQVAGHALLRLINEVLDISRIESGQLCVELSDIALDASLNKAMALAGPMAQARGVRLERAGASGVHVRGDAARLEQVLLNLLSNAIKYGPPEGRVRVAVVIEGGNAVVSVRDDGPGLTDDQREHLFEPFNRLGAERSRTEGVGLGLVIARGLMQHMGGDLALAAVDDQPGACFTLRLPVASPALHGTGKMAG